ncbi:hypothetical protein [Plebeiibacterium marinum]|uniref:Outer membrane protein beta-barrel domain-containing protein n=1 Tax=Plebeiibacterium marinum TaxID=2992111 RepID=A0AAE3MD68_9BACT|nr:hypothetical protein [Plebeiobacterium marinum]MCW3805440.1 hypothetical protein [Plebeiobacterium marinum]
MRKYFLLVLVIASNCLIAQEKEMEKELPLLKGNITIGGGLSFDYDKEDMYSSGDYSGSKSEALMFLLNPQMGYFAADRLELGVGLPVQFMRSLPRGNFEGSSQYLIGVSPYVKYYFKNNLFVQLSAAGQIGKYKYDDKDVSLRNFDIAPSVGYAFFINSKIAIEPAISYHFSKLNEKVDVEYIGRFWEDSYEEEVDFYTENSGVMFSIGFHLFL